MRNMTKRGDVDSRRIRRQIRECAATIGALARQSASVAAAARCLIAALGSGRKILAAGNGGSAAEAMHLAEEFTGRFRTNRVPLPALALCSDGTALTCIANDFGFENVFSRQVEALGRPGDVLVLFSTSGNSQNLILAMEAARRRTMKVVNLLGKTGGAMAGRGDVDIVIPSDSTARIQEAHQLILHLLLDAVEEVYVRKS